MTLNSTMKEVLEWGYCIIIALLLAMIFRYFIGTPTIVKQVSMYPTLVQDQRLWLNRWGRTTKKIPQRGDIITFEAPSTTFLTEKDINKSEIARYEKQKMGIFNKFMFYVLEINKVSYIKRVIGLPGEHIVIKDGKVFIDDTELDESYLKSGVTTDDYNGRGKCVDLIVPNNSVFVMGDNRSQSTDSRCFGCIPLEKIESKVFIQIWPLNVFGKV